MSTTIEDLKRWFNRGKEIGATHLIVVCDTFDWEDYPSYVMPQENVVAKAEGYHGPNMQKVMEVYNLSKPFDRQDKFGRFVFDGWRPK